MNKILVIRSTNTTPEAEVNAKLEELGDDWVVVSATTAVAPHGVLPMELSGSSTRELAYHLYFVTTVVLTKKQF